MSDGREPRDCIAATAAAGTRATVPRQPACTQASTPATGSCSTIGTQSAVKMASTTSGEVVTSASVSGTASSRVNAPLPRSAGPTIRTPAPCTWRAKTKSPGFAPRAAARRRRFSMTRAGSSPTDRLRLSVAYGPDDTPPSRAVTAASAPDASSAGQVSRRKAPAIRIWAGFAGPAAPAGFAGPAVPAGPAGFAGPAGPAGPALAGSGWARAVIGCDLSGFDAEPGSQREGARTRFNCPLPGRGRGFGGAEGAQEVAAGQGGAVGLGPAAGQELGEQRRVGRHVLQTDGDIRGAVEVAAQAHVLDAGHRADVLDVVGDLGQGGPGLRMGGLPLGLDAE